MPPYEHKDFPRRVYHDSYHEVDEETGKPTEKSRLVRDQAEFEALQAEEPGQWFDSPADCTQPEPPAKAVRPGRMRATPPAGKPEPIVKK